MAFDLERVSSQDGVDKHRLNMCVKKTPYIDRAIAESVAKTRLEKKKEIVYPYRCCYCECWHVGHPPDNRKLGKVGDYYLGPTPKKKLTLEEEQDLIRKRKEAEAKAAQKEKELAERELKSQEEKDARKARNKQIQEERSQRAKERYRALQDWENEGGLNLEYVRSIESEDLMLARHFSESRPFTKQERRWEEAKEVR